MCSRLAVVRQSGAAALSCYASIEAVPIGYGCFTPREADDMHLLHDLHALVQPEPGDVETAAAPLYLTSLRSTSPLLLLNVSLGDMAVVDRHRCGCPLESLGWGHHLRAIRSYDKLTAGGMTFLDVDVVRAGINFKLGY